MESAGGLGGRGGLHSWVVDSLLVGDIARVGRRRWEVGWGGKGLPGEGVKSWQMGRRANRWGEGLADGGAFVVWWWGHTIGRERRPGRGCRIVRGGWDYGVCSGKAVERCGMNARGLGWRADPFHMLWGVREREYNGKLFVPAERTRENACSSGLRLRFSAGCGDNVNVL